MEDIKSNLHINKISEALWNNGERGKASIMVGAGFSRNAEKKNSSSKDFPLWCDLAIEMFNELYPHKFADNDFRIAKTAGKNVLSLAQEYYSVFDQTALTSFILRNIPEMQYKPGKLHEKLLKLPWADIFTTNYDTLLERQSETIIEFKYDIVRKIDEIPLKVQPRIIKLHGSFPSTTPFIISEEHYRRYPIDYSPFVNLVQQSMLENVFCLIGFSGSDPNFLAWKGWVRDNLGKNAPPIYLIGVFNYSASELTYFEKSFIKIIDLSIYLPNEMNNASSSEKYNKALNIFFDYILENKATDLRTWPFKKPF